MSTRRTHRWRRLTTTAAIGAVSALLLTTAGTATAAPRPSGSTVPLGDGHLGVSYEHDTGRTAPPQAQPTLNAFPEGIDVSHYQGAIDWGAVKAAGISFVTMKATEGTSYKDPTFNTNYAGAYNARIIRGAYHFARPDVSGGAAQADYFASNGGGWSADNLTLPGVLDIEGSCYGLSAAAMQGWITDFYTRYKARTGRDVMIYTSPSWWNSCTGGWGGMAAKSPLWDAHWTTAASPTLPGGFSTWTFWQYTSSGSVSGVPGAVDRDRFNGDASRLLALANNTA